MTQFIPKSLLGLYICHSCGAYVNQIWDVILIAANLLGVGFIDFLVPNPYLQGSEVELDVLWVAVFNFLKMVF